MKKITITTVLSISLILLSSCSDSYESNSEWSSEKETFMSTCDSTGMMTEYCECCYDQYVKYGLEDRYLEAIDDECMGYLY